MCGQTFLHYPERSYNDILLVLLAVLNIIISLVAMPSNFLVIHTIVKRPSLRTASNILILSLAVSDFGVGLITQPAFCVYKLAELKRNIGLFCASYWVYMITLFSFGSVSFATLTAITLDRFLAVYLHLRYQQIVTIQRYGILVASLWLCSVLTALAKIFAESWVPSIFGGLFLIGGLLVNFVCIFKISRIVQRHSRQIRQQEASVQIHAQQQSVQQSIDMRRYKKSVNTVYCVIFAFVLSYVPTIVVLIPYYVVQEYTRTIRLLFGFAETFIMFNGVLNPIIYCWKVKEIRRAARAVWRRMGCKEEIETLGQTSDG
ncbi:adrenocorticotropic hormone receptor-like [Actinia tenebrosa]|uniref:Adrenocorticotropic hormone receptor-like n=1 Tax=Actinia tenebrosa TaxID=6105 RepID=A0A6P8J410_ACTTE|nr:adrenocorticotropic hormone receptor-like [Actinia tenebrosa]